MTLDTRVLLLEPHATQVVRDFINEHLLCAPDAKPLDAEYWNDAYKNEGLSWFGNAGAQGLDAWFMGYTMGDGPTPIEQYDDDNDPDNENPITVAEGSMMLSFDTGYSYMVAGAGCGDLHAHFVVALASRFGPLWFYLESWGEWIEFTVADAADLLRLGDPAKGEAAVAATRAERIAGV